MQHLNLHDTISSDTQGRLIQRAPFLFKGREYVAVRFNRGKAEVYVKYTSGLEMWVGYSHEVSVPLQGAALAALDHTDRVILRAGL
jgi:hypothetical protein